MISQQHRELVQQLDHINLDCQTAFKQINDLKQAQEDEELVSKLQELISKRQISLDALIADSTFVDASYLERQLEMTLSLKVKAKKVMTRLQTDLHLGKKHQRQINAYKSVDANK
ncbi:flagella biosynthesis chaperone for FliD, FliT [Shewanella gelidii]|uniref:Flagella biosynthesis chaperone for FliD FliT n=1 Tax=Shewanella gelidii TaxID=1642821 RepID=A0A917JJN6_9GAMM|nr:flagella biosynthesis chaperone for FliD, FliT [Shewanella gelidii]MCL1096471.1 flagella biosynthesis chaperone for FliD, FliT [Shewanella gelidii]GGI67590.1 flagella biosynthesis chaperone for FliD FliT [Shewanella gelidii]